jgi:hypothetical protein
MSRVLVGVKRVVDYAVKVGAGESHEIEKNFMLSDTHSSISLELWIHITLFAGYENYLFSCSHSRSESSQTSRVS